MAANIVRKQMIFQAKFGSMSCKVSELIVDSCRKSLRMLK